MIKVPREELVNSLAQLNQSVQFHRQWYRSLVRSLICHLPANSDDLREDAHRCCSFGQWYYNDAPAHLREQPAFIAAEEEHWQLHERAALLLRTAGRGETIRVVDYDEFSRGMDRMRLHLLTLKQEIEDFLNNRDPLTGARSRIGLFTKLREQLELVKREVQQCSIAMLDFDHFKKINDCYGHQAGDRVLIDSVLYLIEHLRPYDTVYRYGGEEFVICMQDLNLESAMTLVERLREDIAATPVILEDHTEIRRTISVGVTLLDPDERVEISLDRADRAMYTAKAAGRNCTRVWDASMVAYPE